MIPRRELALGALIGLSAIGIAIYPPLLFIPASIVFMLVLTSLASARLLAFVSVTFVQFQAFLENLAVLYLPQISAVIQRTDEFLVLFFLLFVVSAKALRPREFRLLGTSIDLPLFFFVAWAMLSALVNRVPPHVALLGVQDVMGNFLFFYVFRALAFDRKQILTMGRLLFLMALLFACTGLLEELVPYEFLHSMGLGSDDFRFGIRRITSFTSNPNRLANYLFPFLFFAFITIRAIPLKGALTFILAIAFFMAFSRQYWLGFLASAAFISLRFKGAVSIRRRVFVLVFCGLFAFILLALSLVPKLQTHQNALIPPTDQTYFRTYALFKSVEVFSDHPIFGVGPGRFGGFVSRMFPSPVYQEYNFVWRSEGAAQIDMYWPQVWAETGLVGFLLYLGILFALYRKLVVIYKDLRNRDAEFAELALVAIAYLIALLIASFGGPTFSTIHSTFIFFGLCGVLLARHEECGVMR